MISMEELRAGMEMMSMIAPVSRDRLSNDSLNTSVMAALIGGFALGSLKAPPHPDSPKAHELDTYIYMCLYFSVHT